MPSRLLLCVVVLTAGDLARAGRSDDDVTSPGRSSLGRSSTSTTTSELLDSACSGVTLCLSDTHCAQCLSAINSTHGFPHTPSEFYGMSLAEQREYNVGFFKTLRSTASCSTDATPSRIIHSALRELGASLCTDKYRMVIGTCLYAEYACFAIPDCQHDLAEVYFSYGHGNKADALRSFAARTTSTLLKEFENYCAGSFPRCTFSKQQCGNSSECVQCLGTLVTGDGAGAARQCRGNTMSALHINNVVRACSNSNAEACSFWRQRCADNANCAACLAVMAGDEVSALAVATDWSTLACQRVIPDIYAKEYMQAMTRACPAISSCRRAVAQCVLNYGDACISCLNGSAAPSQATFCSYLPLVFSLDTACKPCPDSVHTTVVLVLITTVVGGVSATACIAVATTIVARGYSRVSMWYRIVVGLMLSNAVYSSANAIPLNALRSGITNCGHLAMSFDGIRIGRAWWFCGKYGLVSFELFILGASIRALLRGPSAVPPWAEAAMHMACWTCAFVAFVVFYSLCTGINNHGYNANTEKEAYTGTYNYGSLNDDFDDDTPSLAASLEFERGRAEYDNLVRNMLVAWDVLVGMAVLLWVVLRLMFLYAVQMMHTKIVAAAQAEAADVWADTRRRAWSARRRLLEARREAFNEVAKPLEPYIAVFVVFAVPAIVMSTSFCQAHSGANFVNGASSTAGFFGTNFSYGTCDVWCEFLLAFRSLATVAVYLRPRERRIELLSVPTTWRKLVSRTVACFGSYPTPWSYVPVHSCDYEGTYEMFELVHHDAPPEFNDDDDKDEAVEASLTWHIDECDVVKERRLGQGAFGEVWEGLLRTDHRKVAIKTLFARAIDADGDLIDPVAGEDFRKECAALQRIDSPHLIKFFGFGTTKSGNGFIVTELMNGGSLEDMLRNRECHLTWRTRVSLALQIALGMEHLHKRHMLHRDLKSANVLVDEQHTIAKVCDFGISRAVKPARRHIVSYSPFTGVMRLLPRVRSDETTNGQDLLSLSDIIVNIEDASGTMSKAVGTMLWMAPEVFRGDQNYTCAVDVYSFGVVLWEIATRKTPWVHELSEGTAVFFAQLNHALQTGQRPTLPTNVSAEHGAFVTVMTRCWTGDPADRPTFSEAACELAALLRSDSEALESYE